MKMVSKKKIVVAVITATGPGMGDHKGHKGGKGGHGNKGGMTPPAAGVTPGA
jgi:hypothetical protein